LIVDVLLEIIRKGRMNTKISAAIEGTNSSDFLMQVFMIAGSIL
jgi:hypothetical protein